jgi:hypothetical protein
LPYSLVPALESYTPLHAFSAFRTPRGIFTIVLSDLAQLLFDQSAPVANANRSTTTTVVAAGVPSVILGL